MRVKKRFTKCVYLEADSYLRARPYFKEIRHPSPFVTNLIGKSAKVKAGSLVHREFCLGKNVHTIHVKEGWLGWRIFEIGKCTFIGEAVGSRYKKEVNHMLSGGLPETWLIDFDSPIKE